MRCGFVLVLCALSLLPVACSSSSPADTDTDTAAVVDDDSVADGDELLVPDDDTGGGNPLFDKGPYGIAIGDIAANFTVPLDEGDWDLEEHWDGKENYLLLFYRGANSYSKQMFASRLVMLLMNSPKNVHYFFIAGATGDTVAEILDPVRAEAESALDVIDDPAHWRPRLHFVTRGAAELGNWLTDWYTGGAGYILGIDRTQKIRGAGLPLNWLTQKGDFEMAGYEAAYWNFDIDRAEALAAEPDPLVLTGIDGKNFESETITFEVEFPNAAAMAAYTKLAVDLEQVCASQADCEWDRIMQLYICGPDDGDTCGTEVGRWITAYGMGGRWVTDITPLLPLFASGGKLKFRLYVWGYQAKNYLSFRLTTGGDPAPVGIRKLFAGNPRFDENYNDQYAPLAFELPSGATKAAIVAFITGHGNGSEQANCAEFCPFESVFVVNGTAYEKDHPDAATNDGCLLQVGKGVVPNQYGSWPFGRAGWCPGLDVTPWVKEVTGSLVSGENTVAFEAYLDGADYVPVVTDETGYRAEINSASYLVWWE